LVTLDGSGAIGAACEVPETAAKSKPATAIANIVRNIVCSPWTRIVFAKHITPEHGWRFQDAGMNELTGIANQQNAIDAKAFMRPISTPAVA
jgi:hypothetical protein